MKIVSYDSFDRQVYEKQLTFSTAKKWQKSGHYDVTTLKIEHENKHI